MNSMAYAEEVMLTYFFAKSNCHLQAKLLEKVLVFNLQLQSNRLEMLVYSFNTRGNQEKKIHEELFLMCNNPFMKLS